MKKWTNIADLEPGSLDILKGIVGLLLIGSMMTLDFSGQKNHVGPCPCVKVNER